MSALALLLELPPLVPDFNKLGFLLFERRLISEGVTFLEFCEMSEGLLDKKVI